MKVLKSLICMIVGHKWSSNLKPNGTIKPLENRVKCSRCGKYLEKQEKTKSKIKLIVEKQPKVKFK